jgi:hypothetical protein
MPTGSDNQKVSDITTAHKQYDRENINWLVNKYSLKLNNLTCLQPEDDASLLVRRCTAAQALLHSSTVPAAQQHSPCCTAAQSRHLQGEAFQFLGVLHIQDGGTMLPQNFGDYLLFHCTMCQKTCIFITTAVRTSSSHDFSLSVYEQLQLTHQCWPHNPSHDGTLGTVPSAL